MKKNIVIGVLFGLFVIFLVVAWFIVSSKKPIVTPISDSTSKTSEITNFEECVAAGNDVMKSYPRQCRSEEGLFVENIGNEMEKTDLIRLDNPRPNQEISSPLKISGEARGSWFFEGSFPVVLTNQDGQTIAEGIATAEGEWMTAEFVPFSVDLNFTMPDNSKQGTLILKKDNPSGLPENDDALEIPVQFLIKDGTCDEPGGVCLNESEDVKEEPTTMPTGSKLKAIDCKAEQRNADACIEIYQPVCGQLQVECITTPCDPIKETFSNSCKACSNTRVLSYTEGECVDDVDIKK
jgi:hypothetical protein